MRQTHTSTAAACRSRCHYRREGADLEQLQEFINAAKASPTPDNEWIPIIFALFLAAVLGAYLALAYHITYTGKKERRGQMVYTLVLLCLGGSLVWLIVANNLVRAFGLAGALAMIRYRTRMQDPKDTTMVFFAIILGMACGLHQYFTAIFGAVFIGLVLWIIKLVNEHTAMGQRNGLRPAGTAIADDGDAEAIVESAQSTGEEREDDDVASIDRP